MELNGEDKRIRALFCELKREEKVTSPLFAETWNIAEAEFQCKNFSRLRFQPSSNLLRYATAVLVVSLVITAAILLPRFLRVRRQPMHGYAIQEAAAGFRSASEQPPQSGNVSAHRESGKRTDRRVEIRRSAVKKSQIASAQRAGLVKQKGLSEWQSPTAKLLRSAGDELLMLVPQMNESAEDMKKFLSNDLN